MKRRDFLHKSAFASTSLVTWPHLSKPKSTYRVALIGSGWWGMNILREAVASGRCSIAGLCDVDQRQLTAATEQVYNWQVAKPAWYTDYRECIEQTRPDIVIVATPDHWHALPAIAAIEAGAHGYIEKPIRHTVLEGKAILEAARRNDRVVQVGTHRRVSAHNVSAMDFLKSGAAGQISMVKCFVNYSQPPGTLQEDEAIPEGLDWDMWLGPSPRRPYNRRIHPRGFRQFLDYANGTIGDWGIHWFDQVLWWTEEKFPTSIHSTGGRFVKQDGSDAPDTQLAIFSFENFALYWEHKLTAANAYESPSVGCYFYGTEGTLHLGWRDGWTFFPTRKSGEQIHVQPRLNGPDDQNIKELWSDFLQAIEQERRPISDIENGYLATNMSLLAMIALRLGRSVQWDGSGIVNDQEATTLLSRPYRAPWIYPMIA